MTQAPITPPTEPSHRRNLIVPAMFTTANLFAGFFSIVASLKGYQTVQENWVEAARWFDNAARAIGWAVLFDMLDGRIARMTKGTSEFGIELDSLADLVSFGVAPAVLAFAWGYGSAPPMYDGRFVELAWAVSFVYLMCAAFRLARFNVQARRPVPDPKKDRKQFVGMPSPAAAGLIAAIVHFVRTPILASDHQAEFAWFGHAVTMDRSLASLGLLVLVLLLGLLMISTVRYTSFKTLGFGRLSPRSTFLLLSLLVSAIYFYSQWVLLVLASVYAASGPVSRLATRIFKSHRSEESLHSAATKQPL
ncbi:MAG: phosphatidylcholine/phosphatidylserine synthase [Acidobacteriota bacterium]|nr:phosphatidylcholine/phosphatidylserine synthase [Blastocatellia bacterium]MDW8240557.1 phosphatidylcholine/phosphatidylserine synthase [Acidobacteriota bacterium]